MMMIMHLIIVIIDDNVVIYHYTLHIRLRNQHSDDKLNEIGHALGIIGGGGAMDNKRDDTRRKGFKKNYFL